MEEELEPDFVYFGRYSPAEAAKLLPRLEAAGIDLHCAFHDGVRLLGAHQAAHGGTFGAEVGVAISVAANRSEEAHDIHAAIFGSTTPTVPETSAHAGGEMEDHDQALVEMKEADGARQRVAAVAREVSGLDFEIAAVRLELQEGGQPEWRMQALNTALGKHTSRRRRLLSGELTPVLPPTVDVPIPPRPPEYVGSSARQSMQSLIWWAVAFVLLIVLSALLVSHWRWFLSNSRSLAAWTERSEVKAVRRLVWDPWLTRTSMVSHGDPIVLLDI